MAEFNESLSWFDDAIDNETQQKLLEKKKIPPKLFLDNQPMPKEGVICYFGAFSNQL